MADYIVLFREPDGRKEEHTAEEIKQHQLNWAEWFKRMSADGKLKGGSGLSLNGALIQGRDREVTNGIHQAGTEIVGGFLLLEAADLQEAVSIAQGCPIYEFDGYAEVREMQQ